MSLLRKIIKEMIAKGGGKKRLQEGLALVYRPPEGDDPHHYLSASRRYVGDRVVNPSPVEIDVVKRALQDVLQAQGGMVADTVVTTGPLCIRDSENHLHGVVRYKWVMRPALLPPPSGQTMTRGSNYGSRGG